MKIKFIGYVDSNEWKHFLWNVEINGEHFTYKTGTGHSTLHDNPKTSFKRPKDEKCHWHQELNCFVFIPSEKEILESLFIDAEASGQSFMEFCGNFGYSSDSIKAFDTYMACGNIKLQLQRAYGKGYSAVKKTSAGIGRRRV